MMIDISQTTHQDKHGNQWTLEIEWLTVHGRPEPISVKVSPDTPRPFSASQLRQLPVGTWIAETRTLQSVEDQGKAVVDQRDEWGPHRGREFSDAELDHIATVYMEAHRRGAPVTAAVVHAFGVTTSTAGKRILAARRSGRLPAVQR